MKKLLIIATALFLSFATLSSTTMAAETSNYTANSENAEIVPFDADVVTSVVSRTTQIKYGNYSGYITVKFTVSPESVMRNDKKSV